MSLRWNALKRTKDILAISLRQFFANPDNYKYLVPSELNYTEYVKLSENIYSTEPNVLREFPTIIITGGSGQMISTDLSDFVQELHDPRTDKLWGYRYGGIYEFNMTIEVGSRSTLERDFLTDVLSRALRFSLRRKIESQGIIIKSMQSSDGNSIPYDSSHIYIANLSFSTWANWHEDIELVSDVDININGKLVDSMNIEE